MKAKRIIAVTVGITQGAIGIAAVFLACILYFNFFEVQTTLSVPPELVPLCLLILSVFGLFSVISGSFLLRED